MYGIGTGLDCEMSADTSDAFDKFWSIVIEVPLAVSRDVEASTRVGLPLTRVCIADQRRIVVPEVERRVRLTRSCDISHIPAVSRNICRHIVGSES